MAGCCHRACKMGSDLVHISKVISLFNHGFCVFNDDALRVVFEVSNPIPEKTRAWADADRYIGLVV